MKIVDIRKLSTQDLTVETSKLRDEIASLKRGLHCIMPRKLVAMSTTWASVSSSAAFWRSRQSFYHLPACH